MAREPSRLIPQPRLNSTRSAADPAQPLELNPVEGLGQMPFPDLFGSVQVNPMQSRRALEQVRVLIQIEHLFRQVPGVLDRNPGNIRHPLRPLVSHLKLLRFRSKALCLCAVARGENLASALPTVVDRKQNIEAKPDTFDDDIPF